MSNQLNVKGFKLFVNVMNAGKTVSFETPKPKVVGSNPIPPAKNYKGTVGPLIYFTLEAPIWPKVVFNYLMQLLHF